jgi:SNF family Na+-dependent transporter
LLRASFKTTALTDGVIRSNIDIDALDLDGGALAFQTYSTALAHMSGGKVLAPVFFLMVLCLGVDSAFALVELIIATLIDTRLSPFSHPRKVTTPRATHDTSDQRRHSPAIGDCPCS